MSIFKINETEHTKQPIFFGDSVDIQRFDVVAHPHIAQQAEVHKSFFWRPQEIEISKDARDYKSLKPHAQHIFKMNLLRQIVLDSIQGRALSATLMRVVSVPEMEDFLNVWQFFEGSIHSMSYTHIIRNVYDNPSAVFDNIKNNKELTDFATDLSTYYDDFVEYTNIVEMSGYGNKSDFLVGSPLITKYQHKKLLWKLLHAINALEGLRFYVSFACSWAFKENKLMVGNADIITLIANDENLHLGMTQWLIKNLPKQDPDFKKISETLEIQKECRKILEDTIQDEKDWADYLFKDGSMIGLNAEILKQYVDWLGTKRMRAIGMKRECDVKSNPLPWTKKYINTDKDKEGNNRVARQSANQEKDNTEYMVGVLDDDVSSKSFKDFKLS